MQLFVLDQFLAFGAGVKSPQLWSLGQDKAAQGGPRLHAHVTLPGSGEVPLGPGCHYILTRVQKTPEVATGRFREKAKREGYSFTTVSNVYLNCVCMVSILK